MEDVAIAFNYNKIKETMPKSSTIAIPLPINKLGDMLRKECSYAGYTESLAFTLCSHDENFKFLNQPDQGEAVVLANPKTVEYQVICYWNSVNSVGSKNVIASRYFKDSILKQTYSFTS